MKILLADDHRMMRDGLRAVLAREGLEVVGEAATGREAVALARTLRPDIIVMDISMPDLNGVDATRQLIAELPRTRIVALSMHSDRRYVTAMFAAGASAYLVKDSASDELIQAVRAVASGQKFVSSAIAGFVIEGMVAQTTPPPKTSKPLSAREREVLQLIAEGSSSKEIAQRLQVAVPTVETHRRQLMDKLGLRTIAELTKYAIREGLTQLER